MNRDRMTARRFDRRGFFTQTLKLAAGGTALPLIGIHKARAMNRATGPSTLSGLPAQRALALDHTHTGERLNLVYANDGAYLPDALSTLNRFLRDHYLGTVGVIDPQLFDLLHQLRSSLGGKALPAFEVISGYRCPETNEHLRNTRGGGVAKHSLHMEGKAIDIRLPGVPLAELRDAALALSAGGVGYYPHEQFVHVDTGRVRSWG